MTSEQKGLGGGLEIPQICGLTVWNLRTKRGGWGQTFQKSCGSPERRNKEKQKLLWN